MHFSGTTIFFDVEGLPDQDFYYLIGVRLENKNVVDRYSFWADAMSDEKRIWQDFLNLLSSVEHPFLMHYGSYETTFLKKMCDRYGGPLQDSSVGKAIASSVNLLSIIYARIYFPTYSNGLKDIARFLGFDWRDPLSSGLQSIVWRSRWESSRDLALSEQLIAYNTDDCDALSLVTHALNQLLATEESSIAINSNLNEQPEIIHAESLGKNVNSKWREFKSPIVDMERINEAAHWSYQRDRVFVRSGVVTKNLKEPKHAKKIPNISEKTVVSFMMSDSTVCKFSHYSYAGYGKRQAACIVTH